MQRVKPSGGQVVVDELQVDVNYMNTVYGDINGV